MYNRKGKVMEMEEEMYQRILEIRDDYALAKTGRKQIFLEMLKNIEAYRQVSKKHKNDLYQLEMSYKLRNYFISDYQLVMDVILKLANKEEALYGMKEIKTSDFVKYNEDQVRQVYGKAKVIADNEVLDTIDESKCFYYDEFSHMASNILKNGYSLVIVAPNFFEGNVKPKGRLDKVSRKDLKNGGFMGDISCYLQGDALTEAVMQVMYYIDINGPDFQDIDEDTLCNLILENSKEKKLTKNK